MSTAAPVSTPTNAEAFEKAIVHHIRYSLGEQLDSIAPRELFQAVALATRDQMVDRLLATQERFDQAQSKRLYYLSMEFLMGQSLQNNLVNLGLYDLCDQILAGNGFSLSDVLASEVDAALGNGGLGRLAACFLDSLATLDLPGYGYGINYEYGLFKQEIRAGEQRERPDNWRRYNTPWIIERPQDALVVPMYGRVEHAHDRNGNYNPMWLDWKVVIGVPHDMLIVGYGGETVNYLRLFSARASQEVDFSIFNSGDYMNAVQQKVFSETISKVLYPSEAVRAGKELRLMQEYFLVACAVRDIVRRYQKTHDTFDNFPNQVAMQLNDTHPSLTVAELMRVMIDESDMEWEQAWEITRATLAYTNHTLLPEALEKWPVDLIGKVLPRHLQIIFEINDRFLKQVSERWPGDVDRQRRMSLIEENPYRQVRMANLSIVGSHSVNGVAAVHSQLVKTQLVPDFYSLNPEKFNNKTNGVTPRRWLLSCNPGLAQLINECIGDKWVRDLDRLRDLEPMAEDASFRDRFLQVKHENKLRMARVIQNTVGVAVDDASMFDIQIKRIHEYKRQLLNLLHVVHEYLQLADLGRLPTCPRTYIFAGKAAPGYHTAKQIIKLINDVAEVINNDSRAQGHMKVAFVPDYRVSLAEVMIPSAELSEQVSTAGTEASGTGNMKFAMNGALTIGTLDGANIEIREEVGPENIFIFGLTVEQIQEKQRDGSNNPWDVYQRSDDVRRVMDSLRGNRFCPKQPGRHEWVYHQLLSHGEQYFHLLDLESYLLTHEKAGQLYQDRTAWAKKAILNVARMGKFSSDRTIAEYASDIWDIKAVPAKS